MNITRSAFAFFCEHAGYVVGQHAIGAIALARSEALLAEALELGVASVDWLDDDQPWDEGTEISAEEASERFASNEWTGPYVCIVKCGDAVASLSSIVVGPRNLNDPYCRVVAAELASEIADDLRQAIGDARDDAARSSGICCFAR